MGARNRDFDKRLNMNYISIGKQLFPNLEPAFRTPSVVSRESNCAATCCTTYEPLSRSGLKPSKKFHALEKVSKITIVQQLLHNLGDTCNRYPIAQQLLRNVEPIFRTPSIVSRESNCPASCWIISESLSRPGLKPPKKPHKLQTVSRIGMAVDAEVSCIGAREAKYARPYAF